MIINSTLNITNNEYFSVKFAKNIHYLFYILYHYLLLFTVIFPLRNPDCLKEAFTEGELDMR